MTDPMTPTIMPPEDTVPELAATQIQQLSNTGGALAAQVQAEIQARYVVAMQHPRDWDTVRQRMLKECRRPGFAETALYKKPIGGGKFVEGFSIRFAEALGRYVGNISNEVVGIDETDEVVKLRVISTDIETNTSWATNVTVRKTVERSRPREGETVLSSRRNSAGDIVYAIVASDDQILTKTNNLVSKATRNNLMRLCPGDVQDSCEEQIRLTLAAKTKADPDAERKRLLDAFGFFDVLPEQIQAFLGHEVGAGQVSAAELDELRKAYTAVKTGEDTWPEIMRAKFEGLKPPTGGPKSAADKVRERTEQAK